MVDFALLNKQSVFNNATPNSYRISVQNTENLYDLAALQQRSVRPAFTRDHFRLLEDLIKQWTLILPEYRMLRRRMPFWKSADSCKFQENISQILQDKLHPIYGILKTHSSFYHAFNVTS